MPRIPTSGAISPTSNVTTPVGLPGAGLGAVAQVASRASDAAFAVEQARISAQREIELSQSLSTFTAGMNDLQIQAEAQTDPNAMRSAWIEGSQSLLEETSGGLSDPVSKQGFLERAGVLHEQRRIGIERGALALTVSAGQAVTQQRLQELATQAANAKNDLEREEAFTEMGRTIGGATLFYKPEELANLSRTSFALVEAAEITRGSTDLQNARSQAEVDLIGKATTERIDSATHLDALTLEKARDGLASDLRITGDRIRVANDKNQLLAQVASQDKVVRAIYDQSGPQISASQILAIPDFAMSARDKEHWINALEEQAKGGGVPFNPNLYNTLYRRITETNRPDHITNPNEITIFTGSGLDVASADQLRRIAEQNANPETKAHEWAFKQFITSAKPRITKTNMFAFDDTGGDDRYFDFTIEVRRRFDAAISRGEDPSKTLFMVGNKDYLGNLIPQYEIPKDEALSLEGIEGFEAPIAPYLRPTSDAKVRLPNETTQQWRKRMGR